MEKRIKLFLKSKFFKYIGMPVILFLMWAGLTLQYIVEFDSSILILPYNHKISDFEQINFTPLTKGMKITGEFTAQENNLGILQLRFNYHKRIAYNNEDNLLFRLKEKGEQNWYYQSTYKSGLVSDVPFLPFGFPQIANSKGKVYDFELISQNGNTENAVNLKNRFPILITKYKVLRSELMHNKIVLISFIAKKYIRGLENIDIFFSSIAYSLPFFFYLLLLTPLGPRITEPLRVTGIKALYVLENTCVFGYKIHLVTLVKNTIVSYFDIVLLLFILIDILIMQVQNDMMYIVILLLWLYFTKFQKRNKTRTFVVGMGLLVLAPCLLAVNLYEAGEKSTIWAYMFFVFWFGQVLVKAATTERKST